MWLSCDILNVFNRKCEFVKMCVPYFEGNVIFGYFFIVFSDYIP